MTPDVPATTWEAAMPSMTDEGLLLAELSHRVRNEVGASIAAMRLSLARRGTLGREELTRVAIGRLEAFGELLGVMTAAPGSTVSLRPALARMCEALSRGRPGQEHTMISLDAIDIRVPGHVASRFMMVAHELVHNAMRHALDGRRGLLAVIVRGGASEIRLAVVDDGPGMRRGLRSAGPGMGSAIVAQLVRRGGGSISARTNARGTTVSVRLPAATVISVPEA